MSINVAVREEPLVVSGPRRRLPHLPALDGLRGAAVAGVLLFHAGHLTGGYLGVDLFFVLSGYLITSLLVLEWTGTGRIALGAFWARRARRLLPALLAVLIVVGVAAHWFVAPISRGQLRAEGQATLGYVANWYAIFRTNGYWDQTLSPSWLQHTWSLAIEEQFYLVWPLIVVAVLGLRSRTAGPSSPSPSDGEVRRRVGRLAIVAWGGAAASATLMIGLAFMGVSSERLYLGTDTRAAAIMLGAGLACCQWLVGGARPVPVAARRAIAALGLAAAGVLGLAWMTLDGNGRLLYRGGLLVCGVAATVVVLDITTPGISPLQRALRVAPLRWLGLISYGLYLWHWPIYQYLQPGRLGLSGGMLAAVRVSASVAVAWASYRLIEQPVRRGALRARAARVAVLSTAAVAIVALVAGTTGAISPEPQVAAERVARTYTPGPASVPRLLTLGDSVTLELTAEGIVPQARQLGIRVASRALIGCTIMRDADDHTYTFVRNCSPGWPAMVQQYRPNVVMLLLGGYTWILPTKIGNGRYFPCAAPWQRRWRQRLDAAVDTLSAQGAKVVLVSAPTTESASMKGQDPALFDRRQACTNQVVAEVAQRRTEAAFVDLARYVCPDGVGCKTSIDGAELRADGLHYRGQAAKAIARWLVPRVLAAS